MRGNISRLYAPSLFPFPVETIQKSRINIISRISYVDIFCFGMYHYTVGSLKLPLSTVCNEMRIYNFTGSCINDGEIELIHI